MTVPAVNITQLDGAIGVLSPGGRLLALVGVSSSGPLNTPASFARTKDVISTFGAGPLVEAACHVIDRYRLPVLLVRTAASTLGSYLDAVAAQDGTVENFDDSNVTGASVITVQTVPPADPDGAYDVQVLFNVGGTVGVAGIVYQVSLDGGNTWGFAQALGTDTEIDLGIGVVLELTAASINTGDFVTFSTTAPIPASAGEVTIDFSGTSVPTIDAATHPQDDYEVVIRFVAGGTIGTTGITYQWSLDGGRTMSPTTALGTANNIVLPDSGGVKVDFAAGTIAAGDELSFPTVAPRWSTGELNTALDALAATEMDWDGVHVVGTIDPDAFDAIDLKVAGMAADAEYKWWIGNVRMPVGDESEATYFASISAAFAAKASTYGALCYGADRLTSSVSGRKYRRPISFVAAGREISLSEEQNSADVKLGSLTGVSIRDSNGNPVTGLHDEALNPGADDARFYTLRSWKRRAGVYVNQPRLFSAQGSDFQLLPHRRVMNIALETLHDYFVERLNSPILVDPTTGFILESEAVEIETNANARLRAALLGKPKASDAYCVVSRTDNLLSTSTLTGEARVVPLAYPNRVELSVGFSNPALQVVTA